MTESAESGSDRVAGGFDDAHPFAFRQADTLDEIAAEAMRYLVGPLRFGT